MIIWLAGLAQWHWPTAKTPKKLVDFILKEKRLTLLTLLGGEQAWTLNFYLKSFVMDSVQVGKAVFVKENYTTRTGEFW